MIDNELKAKLLAAKSEEELVVLLKEAGADRPSAERVWAELTNKREAGGKELSLDELEAINGGADRDFLKDGCAATMEPGSWCNSNDRCYYWDVTYDNKPTKTSCPFCGSDPMVTWTMRDSDGIYFICSNCGNTIRRG